MDPSELLTGDTHLTSLPEVYYKLQEAIDDEDSSFDEIGGLISSDPALATRLLKLANSAFYGFFT
ncbi:MAG: hypothetical protein COV67_14465 [Nitrospinae bacterium CG11_big_fil_rev_8_21_14_0_20_56_8]|nr:MAG: hypothetical protein COV67_14465 [Nitrospinae bacterium CG11_big_fil_rev_8_21_14_0_20_56_8]